MEEKVETPVSEGNPSGPSQAELESEAAAFLGVEVPTSEQEPTDAAEPSEAPAEQPAEQPKADEPKAVQAEEPKADLSEEDQALLADVRAIKEVTGTPFKSVQDVVKAWKEAQAELTRRSQATKPYEQLLTRVENDPRFKQALEQLEQFYENPQLAQAYLNQQNPNVPPDPRGYNLDDPQDMQRWNKDLADYQERVVDSRIQTRLAPLESKRVLEQQKLEFRQQFPDADPDKVLERASEIAKNSPLVNVHKALEYDNMKAKMANMESEIRAKVTKELTAKLEAAGKTTTPQASVSAPKPSVSDIVSYVSRYGMAAAAKKFGGDDAVEAAIAEATNSN